jgi:hypothetical protein
MLLGSLPRKVTPMQARRRLVAALASSFVLVPLALAHPGSGPGRVEACAAPAAPMRVGSTVACVHADVPPPGVDVTEHVATAELRERAGAGPAAYEAAQDLGVAGPVSLASTASNPDVACDGDGTSGYRVQAMYVVEAGRTNRYAALLPSFRLWAAGTDDVVNRSAALTGGVRHVRFVTEPGGSGCVASVLNVTVPAGSMTSFGATVSAVQALGYTSPGRKYLMWTDATVLCGVASMYTNDGATQANPNNGSYPQYARVDSGCWGLGDGAGQHSVEAHELLHTLGGVQSTAPHSTRAGHCWDESDTMCYADGGGYAMKQICPAEREYFFDCNNDDYFSTYPDPGGYLAGHWNAADSRFLVGGGDGVGGGTLGSPTVLGATIAVNNPAVPGLATQVSVAPALPDGRTLTSVSWKSARADCVFGTPAEVQSTVTCAATATGSTTVTATLVDSSGATKSVSSPLTFLTGTARPVRIVLSAAAQSTDSTTTASVCTSAGFPLVATVVDVATGAPVKGLTVAFTKKTATMTAPASAGSALSTVAGTATLTQSATVATDYVARTAVGTVFAAAVSPTLAALPAKCTPALTGTKDHAATYYGDPVVVTGTLTRAVPAGVVPVAGASVVVRSTVVVSGVTKVTALGTATTALDGSYRVVVKPTASGAISAVVLASTAYNPASVALGDLVVSTPATTMTATVDRTDVGYGSTITATGRLERDAGGVVTPLTGKVVGLFVTPPGRTPVQVASGMVTSAGTWRAAGPLRYSGALVARYAGTTGQPAAQVALGDVVAGTWATALTAATSTGQVPVGGSMTVSGSLSRSYLGVSQPAAGVRLTVYFQASGSSTRSAVAYPIVSASGTFAVKVYPRATGSWTVVLSGVTGYANATSAALPVTVS